VSVTTVWSVKGGQGVSVVAGVLAALLGERHGSVLLVDRAGDQPAVLGRPEPTGPGVHDWLAVSHGDGPALARLEVDGPREIRLVPRGRARSWPPLRERDLAAVLGADPRPVVVDAGLRDARTGPAEGVAPIGRSVLVVRPCYLALRRVAAAVDPPDDVVLVVEPGRALDRRDVEHVLGRRLAAVVEYDPAVSRSVDAGLVAVRPPAPLRRSLRRLL
jgi:hypothetical protein